MKKLVLTAVAALLVLTFTACLQVADPPSFPLTGLSFNPGTRSISVGQTVTLNAIRSPTGATGTLLWSFLYDEDKTYVSLNPNTGEITGVAATLSGSPVTITAIYAGDSSIYAQIDISVTSVVYRFAGGTTTRFANDAPNGRVNGFDYEAWTDHRGAEGFVMYIYNDGSFSGTWNQTYNTLFRMGRRWPGQISNPITFPTVGEVGNISVHQSTASFTSTRGATYLTLYGWVLNPQIEWYIVESWRNWVPVDNNGNARSGYTHHGYFTSNGVIYDVVTGWRIGQPALTGQSVNFLQIFSVRRGSQLIGEATGELTSTINVTEHFNFWANIGPQTHATTGTTMEFSDSARLYEVSWCVEGFGGMIGESPANWFSSGNGRVTALCIIYGVNRVCTSSPGGCDHCQ